MPEMILIVDDDRELREELVSSLQGYRTIEAPSAEEALRILKKPHEIGLVVLDVMLPGMRGTEILSEIKKHAPGAAVAILTGHGSKDVAVEALRGHADEYIEKPVDPEELKEAVDRLLDSKGKADEEPADIRAKVEKAMRFAERNKHKSVRLEDAAEAVCLSPKYLSRVFREITGKRFSDYRLGLKMASAKELLRGTRFNVNQIADRMGYQNTESFIRAFEKITGSTPARFRKRRPARRKKKGPGRRRRKRR
jgi:YesN/AraC family two-component response regulator